MNEDQRKWEKVSVAFETEPSNRTNKQRNITESGLCRAIKILDINLSTTKFAKLFTKGYRIFWWKTREQWDNCDRSREADLNRATAAGFMAQLSIKEIREISRSI